MLLFYIRHGQSANNALYDATGNDIDRVCDPELTSAGVAQAARVAEALKCGRPLVRSNGDETAGALKQRPLSPSPRGVRGFGITHLYCSLMVRAVHTGQAIAQSIGLPLLGWTELHEGGGIFLAERDSASGELVGYPGSSRAELAARFPELVWPADARPDGWWNRPFEPKPDRTARARRVLAELLRRHGGSDDRVAFVSHGGFFYRFMCAALGMPADPETLWFHMYNTAITCLELGPNGATGLRYLNRIDHLPPELIT